MSKKKEDFLKLRHGSETIPPRVILASKIFSFNDPKQWRFHITILLENFWGACDVSGRDFNDQLEMIMKEVKAGKERARAIIGNKLGNWRYF